MKRVSRACQQCRSKHIKCNGRSPCSRCIAHAELHNISPSEICLYPEPKKRGRPSASTTHHTHSTHNTSSVVKKKLNHTNKGRVTSPSGPTTITRSSSSTSPTNNVINLQPQRWQKPVVTQSEPITYWNGNDMQSPFIQPLTITQNPLPIAPDFFHGNFPKYNDGLFNQYPQQQTRVLSINTFSQAMNSHLKYNPQNNDHNNSITTNNNNYYRHAYHNANNNTTRSYGNNSYSTCNMNSTNANNNATTTILPQTSILSLSSAITKNNILSSCSNHNNNSVYHLNRSPYGHHHLSNSQYSTIPPNFEIYLNHSYNNENSDSSDSPYSSISSTPEPLNPGTSSIDSPSSYESFSVLNDNILIDYSFVPEFELNPSLSSNENIFYDS